MNEYTFNIGTITVEADCLDDARKAACGVLSDEIQNEDIEIDVQEAEPAHVPSYSCHCASVFDDGHCYC